MAEQPEPAAWVVLGVPALGLLAFALLRWVPAGHLLVVTRRGRVERVVPSGLRLRAPVSTSVLVPTGPDVALVARGTTREGIQVRLVVETDSRLVTPARHQRFVDPVVAAAEVGEQVLAAAVAHASVPDLPDVLLADWDALTADVDRATARHGLRVRSMRLVELDAVLAAGADGPR